MSQAYEVRSCARPVRVAYFVDIDAAQPEILDEIFAECYGRWGGRWTLIVPCSADGPKAAYLPWLRDWDPDLIYTYVELSIDAHARLHEEFYPGNVVVHTTPRSDEPRPWRPDLDFHAVSSLTVLPWLAARRGRLEWDRSKLLDVYWTETNVARWIRDSFGLPRTSVGATAVVDAATTEIPTLTLISQAKLDDPRVYKPTIPNFITSENDWLGEFANNRAALCMADAASFLSPRLDLNQRDWSTSLNLVVGETNADRVLFWNAYHYNDVFWPGLRALRVDVSTFQTETGIKLLADLIKNRNQHEYQGTHSTTIRSCSLDETALIGFADELRSAMSIEHVTYAAVNSPDACIPQTPSGRYQENYRFTWPQSIDQPKEVAKFLGAEITCPKPTPPQYIEISQMPHVLRAGAWMIDIEAQRFSNYSPYINVHHLWMLPRRLRLAFHFVARGSRDSSSDYLWMLPRVEREGLLSIAVNLKAANPELVVPPDDRLLRVSLLEANDWTKFHAAYRHADLSSLWLGFKHSEVSDKGQYLIGTLQLFGSFERTIAALTDRVWISVFDKLGADPGRQRDTAVNRVMRSLRKREAWKKFPLVIQDEEGLRLLVEKGLTAIGATDIERRFLTFAEIEKLWQYEQTRRYRGGRSHLTAQQLEDLDQAERRGFVEAVEHLAEREVLHQGQDWACPDCLHRNWLGIAHLSRSWRCEVCGYTRAAEVEAPWQFRANGFLIRALRDHGMLPIIWCLKILRDRAQRSFYFLPSESLWTEAPWPTPKPPTAEFDLLAVVDGKVNLCEVKSSSRMSAGELHRFVEVANKVRPDKALIALYDDSADRANALKERLSKLLAPGIAAEVLTRPPHSPE